MDLEKLNSIDTTKADEVKALQSFLKTRGYYSGPIDGKWGGGTTEGAGNLRDDLKLQSDRDLELEKTRTAGKVAESEGKKAENDPTARLTKMGTELAPYGLGIVTGTGAGHYGFGKPYAKADTKAGEGVSKLAKALDVDPKTKEEQLNRMNTRRNVRNTAQFAAPALLGGAGYATRELIAPMFSDPQTQDIVRGVGTGENAAAMTLGVHQLVDTLRRGNPNDPVDEARIRSGAKSPGALSRALAGSRPGPAAPSQAPAAALPPPGPETPPAAPSAPSGPNPGTQKYMAQQAKALGIKNAAKMPKSELAKRLSEAVQEHGGKRTVGPRSKPGGSGAGIAALVGGGVAADAAYNDARAEGATPMQAIGSAAPAAATTAGIGAGAGYGMSKLAQALGPMAGQAFGMGAGMSMPQVAMSMGPETQEEANQERSRLAVNYPRMAPMLGLTDEMGQQLPTRAPVKDDEFASARALQVPQGIPLPQPDGGQPVAPPPQQPNMMNAAALEVPSDIPPDAAQQAEIAAAFSPNVQGRLRRMVSLGAPPEAIANFLNQSVR